MSGQDKNMKGIGQPLKASAEKVSAKVIETPKQDVATDQAQTDKK